MPSSAVTIVAEAISGTRHECEPSVPLFWPFGLAPEVAAASLKLGQRNRDDREEVEKTQFTGQPPASATPNHIRAPMGPAASEPPSSDLLQPRYAIASVYR